MTSEARSLIGSKSSLQLRSSVGGKASEGEGRKMESDEWMNGDIAEAEQHFLSASPAASRRTEGEASHAPATPRGVPDMGRWTPLTRSEGADGTAPAACTAYTQCASDSLPGVGSWRREDVPRLDFAAAAAAAAGVDDATSDIASVARSATADSEMHFPRVPAHQRVDVVFEDLEVSTKDFWQKERKVLLHGVSGQFRAGELVAVMGPSGAGKTTLLNTISGFTKGLKSGGAVRLQRQDGSVTTKRSVACYLTQDDHVEPLFTVREIVRQAADLKVGSRLSGKARGILVDDVLETLGLAECSCTRASQLSGGQRKRLAIAAELIDNPYVIFLDEPTTGLDMSTATQCTQLMQRIAHSGRAVICTVHQPSENMLNMYDQVYILAEGRCAYRGPPNHMLPFLNSLGFQCPQYHSPVDFMLEVANNEYGNAVPVMIEAAKNSEYPPPLPDVKEYEANGKLNGIHVKAKEMEALINGDSYQPSEWERFRILVTRNLLLQHRDWASTHTKLFAAILVALAIGAIFGPIGDNAHRIMSNISVLFIVVLYQCYTPEAPAVMKYSEDIAVVKREWFNNWYCLITYSFALLISTLPMHVMVSTLLCSITYYMTGQLAEPLRFAHFTIAVILTAIASESLGLQFGSLFLKKKIVSLFIAATHLAYLILFAGFLALKPEMPDWYDWGSKVNHLHYSFNSMLISTYKNRTRISCPKEVLYCHYRDPDSILNLFGLANSEIWPNYLALIIFITVLRITGFLTLNYNVKRANL